MRTKNLPSPPPAVQDGPLRTCLACRKVMAKKELVRLVRASSGIIDIDTKGKKDGRGAYLCRNRGCWDTGLKGNRLEHALRGSVSPENRKQLFAQAEALLKEPVSGKC